ncbi:MAG: hypothetical protein NTU53_00920 [Planctomycetota bacterium]|nr:hypothetical protein [Planctomycetota bacterium]
MAYAGHVENGAIVLDEPADLPDGAVVKIELVSKCVADGEDTGPSFTQRFAEVLGKTQSLPEDAAENHDHYLYGVAGVETCNSLDE